MDHVVNVVKVIGKRCLSYRGSEFEAAYILEDQNVDYGNFLEIIMLLSMYGPCLQQHLTECIEKSINSKRQRFTGHSAFKRYNQQACQSDRSADK